MRFSFGTFLIRHALFRLSVSYNRLTIQNTRLSLTERYVLLSLLFLIIITSVSTESNFPQTPAYISIIFLYSIFVIYAFLSSSHHIRTDNATIALLSVICIVFILHMIISPEIGSNILTAAPVAGSTFVIFAFVNIMYIPSVIRISDFLWVVAGVSTVIVILGGVGLILGSQSVGFDPIHHKSLYGLSGTGTFSSIFKSPNSMGRLTGTGLVAVTTLAVDRKKRILYIFAAIIGIGLIFSGSRADVLAVIAGSFVYFFYLRPRLAIIPFLAGAFALIYFLGVVSGVVPGPDFITSIDLRNRTGLWLGAVQAIFDSPIIGYGFEHNAQVLEPYLSGETRSVHNSHLRVFLISGIVGGFSYIGLLITGFYRRIRSMRSRRNAIILALAAVILVSQSFDGTLIFGLRPQSILGAIIVGYYVYPS